MYRGSRTKMTLIRFIQTNDHLLRGFGCKILAIIILENLSCHISLDTLYYYNVLLCRYFNVFTTDQLPRFHSNPQTVDVCFDTTSPLKHRGLRALYGWLALGLAQASGQQEEVVTWMESQWNSLSRWWFLICFYFHPKNWRNSPIWRAYFSNGLKPPTSCCPLKKRLFGIHSNKLI